MITDDEIWRMINESGVPHVGPHTIRSMIEDARQNEPDTLDVELAREAVRLLREEFESDHYGQNQS